MEIDPSDFSESELYRITTSAVVPRPIGWIGTISSDGVDNLAPFSSFMYASHAPIVLMFSSGRKDGEQKDTVANILETEEFTANIVNKSSMEKMDKTSKRVPEDTSEFDIADIDRTDSECISAPRVTNTPVSFECELYHWLEIEERDVIFGEAIHIYVEESVMSEGEIDAELIDAVGRIGGPYYSDISQLGYEREY